MHGYVCGKGFINLIKFSIELIILLYRELKFHYSVFSWNFYDREINVP